MLAKEIIAALHLLDDRGHLPHKAAYNLRREIKDAPEKLKQDIRFNPEKHIGLFETLPANAKQVIVNAIAKEDELSMIGHQMGILHIMMVRLIIKLKYATAKYDLNKMRQLIMFLEVLFRSGPVYMIDSLFQWQLAWQGKYSLKPSMHSMLKLTGIKPRDLAICYARDIPQPLKYRGFWHDSNYNSTYGVAIAIDFIPTPEGFWHIENNLNFAASIISLAPNEFNAIVSNIFSFISKGEYQRLVIVNKTHTHIDRELAELLEVTAHAQNIKLIIIEDAYLLQSHYVQSYSIPFLNDRDTLVVRLKCYNTSLDYLLDNKLASQKILEIYKKKTSDPYLLLPVAGEEPVIKELDQNDAFPNLIYKFPDNDAGQGLIFIKARSNDHAKEVLKNAIAVNHFKNITNNIVNSIKNKNGYFQSYIHSPFIHGRRLSKVRAHVLITPNGIQFLSAHRVISKFTVPDNLSFGLVQDHRPYLVNLSTSSKYVVISDDEKSAVINASLSVAKGMSWAARLGYKTSNN